MKLYVVRHGQTTWNAQGRVCGRADPELTQEGLQQAEELAKTLPGKGIVRVLASPLYRTQQTAAILSHSLGLPVETEPRLIEQDYGIYDGGDIQSEGFAYSKGQFARRYPGGESQMQVAGRVYPLLDELMNSGKEGNVLLVCHGGVCRVIRTYFEDMTNEEFVAYRATNCQMEEYGRD